MVFTFLSWLDILGVVLAFWISFLNLFKLFPKYWPRVTDIKSFEQYLQRSLGHTLSFIQILWNIVSRICFWRNISSGLLRWSSQQTTEGQISNFVSSGSKIVKRIRSQKYDTTIIARTICLVLGPYTALYISFLIHCILTMQRILFDGTCQNLFRGGKAMIIVPSDC